MSGEYLAVGCPRCVGNNRCNGRCLDGSMCGRCNATHTTQCFADSDCSSVGTEYCETNRCRDGQNFGNSVSILHDAGAGDYVLAVGAFQDGTAVDMGESYDRTGHGAVYLFQQNLCCFNGSVMATSGDACGAPYSPDSCDDVWGQVKGLL